MKKQVLFALCLGLLSACGLIKKSPVNQTDKEGKRIGHWVSYWNDTLKIKMYDGYYLNDQEVGTCTYFHPNGKPSVRFKYGKKRIKVNFKEPDGKPIQKGYSRIVYTNDSIAYYYHGKWRFYENGRLQKVSIFEHSHERYILKERQNDGKMIRYSPPKKMENVAEKK
jgi:hypothetical protein